MIFHGFWLVSTVFQGGFMVFGFKKKRYKGKDGGDDDDDDDDIDDIYIMVKCLFVCMFVTKNHHFHGFSWFLVGFRGFWLVSMVFHGFWLVFMVFQGSFM